MSSVVERLQKLRNRLNASNETAASADNDAPAKGADARNENNENNDETSETDAQPKNRRGPIRSGGAKASPRDDINDDGKKNDEGGDIEMGINNRNQALVKQIEQTGPLRVLEPLRADPIKLLQTRQRRLERVAASALPEIHFVGHITSGQGLIYDTTEGACCRWKVEHGKAWEHLGGELIGQTQISYCEARDAEYLPFNHPIDLHFAEAGIQGWGAPRISMQCYRMDWHGRRLLSGYGFAHLPTTPGLHRIEVCLWRPTGSPEQEMDAFLLGRTPALVSHEPIYESAWKDRSRLVTVPSGKVFLDLFVVTRFLNQHDVE